MKEDTEPKSSNINLTAINSDPEAVDPNSKIIDNSTLNDSASKNKDASNPNADEKNE